MEEELHDVACPRVDLGRRHRRAQSHRAPLRHRDDHVQELLPAENRIPQREGARAGLALEQSGNQPDRFGGRALLGDGGGQLRESRRFGDDKTMQRDRRR